MTHACTFCRARKIRCDKKQPCSSCVRLGNPDCQYVKRTPSIRRKKIDSADSSIKQELDNLKKTLSDIENAGRKAEEKLDPNQYQFKYGEWRNLKDVAELMQLLSKSEGDQEFGFGNASVAVNNKCIERRFFGFTSWKAYFMLDPGLRCLGNYTRTRHNDYAKPAVTPQEDPVRRKAEDAFKQVLKVKHELHSNCNTSFKQGPGRIKPTHMFLGAGDDDEETLRDLKFKIERYLPTKKVIWKYLDVFFDRLYTVVPIIDELEFKGHLYRLFEGTAPEEQYKHLKITETMDFAILGILLLVLRLAYLSMLPNTWELDDSKESDLEEQCLFKYPINIEAVSLSRSCLNVFNPMGQLSITTFQFLLITKIYSLYGPECGDGVDKGDASLFNSILFHIAFSLGLHRDPDTFPLYQDERSKNLARKMWAVLVVIDLSHTLEFGEPLNVCKYTYDTKSPISKVEGSNLMNSDHEKAVVDCYKFLDNCKELQEFLGELCNVNKKFTVRELMERIKYLRTKLYDSKESTGVEISFTNTSGPDAIMNVAKYKIQMQFGYFVCSIHFHLFMYFEKLKQYDVASYFLMDVMKKILILLLPFYFQMMDSRKIEPAINFVLLPDIQAMLNKASMFLVAVLFRTKNELARLRKNPTHFVLYREDKTYKSRYDNLQQLSEKILGVCESIHTITNRFSRKYFFSWVVSRIFRFFVSVFDDEVFELELYQEEHAFPILNDDGRVSQLLEIFDVGLELKRKTLDIGICNFSGDLVSTAKTMIATGVCNGEHSGDKAKTGSNSGPNSNPDFNSRSDSNSCSNFQSPHDLATSDQVNYESTDSTPTLVNSDETSLTSNTEVMDLNSIAPETIDSLWMQLMSKGSENFDPSETTGVGSGNYNYDIPQVNYIPMDGVDLGLNAEQTLLDEIFNDF